MGHPVLVQEELHVIAAIDIYLRRHCSRSCSPASCRRGERRAAVVDAGAVAAPGARAAPDRRSVAAVAADATTSHR